MRTKASRNAASSAAITTSHASAKFTPAPAQTPLTAATNGTGVSRIRRITPCNAPSGSSRNASMRPSFSHIDFISRRSPPEQNARPLPVKITARASSNITRRNAASRSIVNCIDNAFNASGRFIVTVATPLFSSYVTVSSSIFLLAAKRHKRHKKSLLFCDLCAFLRQSILTHAEPASGWLRDSLYTAPSGRLLAGKARYHGGRNCRRRSQNALAHPHAQRPSSNGISHTVAAASYFVGKRSPDLFR